MQVEQQFQDGMSRERFWQEVALRFAQVGFTSLFAKITETNESITEGDIQEALSTIARHSFDAADQLAERHGPDNLPRKSAG